MRERTRLEDHIGAVKTIESDLNDNAEMIALGEAEGDDDIVLEAEKTLKVIKIDVESAS